MRFIIASLIGIFACLVMSPAEARHRHHHYQHRVRHIHHSRVATPQIAQNPTFGFFPLFEFAARAPVAITGAIVEGVARVIPHPSNCPRTAFCACGAADEVGVNPRTHMSARSFYQYPRSYPAPNTVAVRPHHVFVLKEHVRDDVWIVVDHNSGHHQSHVHARSIRGYTIVNPHA